ncbi:hypothetical protein F4818DRAFT_446455 [Hypoxylon cercidicola]|nr:hypothetical protein F4818DRAFT_446455 [Hypoxylon cercidicola]
MISDIDNGKLQMPSAHIPDQPPRNLIPDSEQSMAVDKKWFWENETSIHIRFFYRNPNLELVIKDAAGSGQSTTTCVGVYFDKNLPDERSRLGKLDHENAPEGPTMTLDTMLSKKDL